MLYYYPDSGNENHYHVYNIISAEVVPHTTMPHVVKFVELNAGNETIVFRVAADSRYAVDDIVNKILLSLREDIAISNYYQRSYLFIVRKNVPDDRQMQVTGIKCEEGYSPDN